MHYSRHEAMELHAFRYDQLRNYYSKYPYNQYVEKNLLDRSISNTMNAKKFSAKELLRESGVLTLDAARFVGNIFDAGAGGTAGFFNQVFCGCWGNGGVNRGYASVGNKNIAAMRGRAGGIVLEVDLCGNEIRVNTKESGFQ